MINYPSTAITFKTQDRLLYTTYDAIGINMLKYNNDSSNVFNIIDIACMEIGNAGYDINYQMNLTLNNVDFISIDRINRFLVKDIKVINYNQESGIYESDKITGYSRYTNREYDLRCCDKFLDFARHTLPFDAFLENTGNPTLQEIVMIISPNLESDIDLRFTQSRITVNILTVELFPIGLISDGYDPEKTDNILPYIKITGLDKDYKESSEKIFITRHEDLQSTKEFIRLSKIILFGFNHSVTVKIEPYAKNRVCNFNQSFVDREEQYTFDTICTVDQYNKSLVLLSRDNSISFLSQYTAIEKADFNLLPRDNILDYHIDYSNNIIYMIVEELGITKSLYAFPLLLPYSRRNLHKLQRTQNQAVKVEYTRDTLQSQYNISVFPSHKAHGVDSVRILKRSLFEDSQKKGQFQLSTASNDKIYTKGDVVSFNNENWICNTTYTVLRRFSTASEGFDTTSDRYVEDRSRMSMELETTGKWTKEKVILKDNIIIDLLRYNIETNTFVFKFSELFNDTDECILEIEVNGLEHSSCQILVQDKKIEKLFSRTITELFSYVDFNSLLFTDGTIYPLSNSQDQLLSDNINTYKTSSFGQLTIEQFKLYYVSSRNYMTINGYNIVPIFDSFYFDESTKTIVTSDTISHIFNKVDNTSGGTDPWLNGEVLAGNVDIDPSPAVILRPEILTDKEDNVFFRK